jgi:hypothetical protein
MHDCPQYGQLPLTSPMQHKPDLPSLKHLLDRTYSLSSAAMHPGHRCDDLCKRSAFSSGPFIQSAWPHTLLNA